MGVMRPGSELDYQSTFSAEVKNGWSYTSTPVHLHGVEGGQVYLLLFYTKVVVKY